MMIIISDYETTPLTNKKRKCSHGRIESQVIKDILNANSLKEEFSSSTQQIMSH